MSRRGNSRDYIKDYKEQFDMFDENGDGRIEVKEVQSLMRKLGKNPSNAEAQELIDKMDIDRDGKVTIEEFAQVMHNQQDPKDDELEAAFRTFDRNGDGYLDEKELKNILTSFGEPLTNKEVNDAFKDMDTNRDGKIDIPEFIALMKSK